jgi:hypothetical protein
MPQPSQREGKDLCILGRGHANFAHVYRFKFSFCLVVRLWIAEDLGRATASSGIGQRHNPVLNQRRSKCQCLADVLIL